MGFNSAFKGLMCQFNSQMANYKEQNIGEKIKKDTKLDPHESITHKTNIRALKW
jgi:hypothetical protein